jgi:hypothetical protein
MTPFLKRRRFAVPSAEEPILSVQELCDVRRADALYRQRFSAAVIE